MMYCCWLIFGSIQNECEESHPMILLNTGECGLWDLVQALVWTDITKFIVFKMYALNIYIYILRIWSIDGGNVKHPVRI